MCVHCERSRGRFFVGSPPIQRVPGAGQEARPLQWMELFRRIQTKGKSVLLGAARDEIETLIRELDPARLLIGTSAETAEQAEALLAGAARWTGTYWGRRRNR